MRCGSRRGYLPVVLAVPVLGCHTGARVARGGGLRGPAHSRSTRSTVAQGHEIAGPSGAQ
jgi:hypothetical protein